MEWFNHDIADIPRQEKFPFRVVMLYVCGDLVLTRNTRRMPEDSFEVSIRLTGDAPVCGDTANGTSVNVPWPNAAFKLPGSVWQHDGSARDTVAFAFPAEVLELLRKLGMYPAAPCKAFVMTPEIETLILRFRKMRTRLYSPGVADEIDWLCFRLYRELFFSNTFTSPASEDREKIKNISLWLQVHLPENFSMEDIARTHGFSRASFFRKWKEVFDVSPLQYILDLRIEAAARLLRETDMNIDAVCRHVNFSGLSAFYRRFAEKYASTPETYRRKYKA